MPAIASSYDLVVIGGTPGGIACAVRAAREGLRVLLVNHTRHLGGFITSGAGGWEAPYDGHRSPLYSEMLTGAAEYYKTHYGEESQQYRASLPNPHSNAHIERPKVEPRVAELLFEQMVWREPTLTVLKGYYVSSAERSGARLTSVTLREMHGDRTLSVEADMFADGLYEGDLAAAAGVPCKVGRESRSDYGEPHAGVIYSTELPKPPGQPGFPRDAVEGRLKIRYNSHATGHLLPAGTGEGDGSVMAYNYRLILTKEPGNRVPIPKPENYDPDAAKKVSSGSFAPGLPNAIANRPNVVPNIPNHKVGWNGGRLIGPQNDYPEADWPTRERIARHYLDTALSLLWFYQNDPAAPEAEREYWKDYGLAADEFTDNENLPYEIYVREARRLVGRHVFTEHDNVVAPGLARPPIHRDSIAITDWPIDSVACTHRGCEGAHPEGIFFLAEEARPAQVPYRSILPQGVDNLLVPVALSASHVGWGPIRLEPVWMQTGEAAGFAAALAKRHDTTPGRLDPDVLLRTLVEHRVMVSFFNDVEVTSGEPWVAAVQYFGTKGFFASYDARPAQPLTTVTAKAWARIVGHLSAGQAYDGTEAARDLPKEESGDAPAVTASEFEGLLRSASMALPDDAPTDEARRSPRLGKPSPLTRADACRLAYAFLHNRSTL